MRRRRSGKTTGVAVARRPLPAIPPAALRGPNEETDNPDREDDQRDPPKHVYGEAKAAQDQREQKNQKHCTHCQSPPSHVVKDGVPRSWPVVTCSSGNATEKS